MSAELRTHLIPFVLVAAAGPSITAAWMAAGSPPPPSWPDLLLYLGLGLALFGASSLYHAAAGTPLEEALNKLDHLGIHLMIAGTGTVHMKVLPAIVAERVPWMLAVVWALAAIGILYRLARGDRARGQPVMGIYALMAATVLPTIDWASDELWAPPMLVTYAALAVFALSAAVLFPRAKLHAWWHLGTVIGYALAGAAILL